jgi:hypothetical protein
MTTQTTYSERMPRWVAGFDPDMSHGNRITRSVEGAGGIGFGLAVGRGTDREGGAVVGGTLDLFLGVSVLDPTQEVREGLTVDKYPQYAGITIKEEGPIVVQVSGTPGPDDPVHYNASTGVFAASGGSGPILGARWATVAANGLCKLQLPRYGQAT